MASYLWGRAKLRLVAALLLCVALVVPGMRNSAAATAIPVTGTFYGNDNGVYYLQQSGSSVWWMGESVDKDPNPQGGLLGPNHVWHRGLTSTSVFQGTVVDNGGGMSITGRWVEVSRGASLRTGAVTVGVGSVTIGTTTYLTLSSLSGSGPDGTNYWQQGPGVDDNYFQYPDGHTEYIPFYNRFQQAKKPLQASYNSHGDKLGDTNFPSELRPYRDQTVFNGSLQTRNTMDDEVPHVNLTSSPSLLQPGGGTYSDFACSANDGDLDLRVRVDLLHLPSDFPTYRINGQDPGLGWGSANATNEGESGYDHMDVLPKFVNIGSLNSRLAYAEGLSYSDQFISDPSVSYIGTEGLMYGGNNVDGCPASAPLLLPGWAAPGGNSILVNGVPVDGFNHPEHLNQDPNPCRPTSIALSAINGYPITAYDPNNTGSCYQAEGTEVRVTGALSLDCGHAIFPGDDEDYSAPDTIFDHSCEQGEATGGNSDGRDWYISQNQEIHPIYSLDIIECPLGHYTTCPSDKSTVRQNLTGAWASDDGGTTYIRQIGNDIWWTGLRRNRDPIMQDPVSQIPNPTNVFHGTITQQADGSATIAGDALTVPKGYGPGGLVDTATFTVKANRKVMDLTTSGNQSFPWPSHFEKIYEPPDTVPPCSTLTVGSPQYSASGVTFVTSATPMSMAPCTRLDADQTQTMSYRFYPVGSTPPPYTPVVGAGASFNVTGADGRYVLETYATDDAGNDEVAHHVEVRLDNTAPLTTVTQPTAASYNHSATLTLHFGASDGAGAGLASMVARLDGSLTLPSGQALSNGLQIPLLTQVPLGTHKLSVKSRDFLGNTVTKSVTFTVIATASSIQTDVRQFVTSGDINDQSVANSWLTMLQAAAKARANSDCTTASQDYNSFINDVHARSGQAVTATAAGILVKDAQYLIAHCP